MSESCVVTAAPGVVAATPSATARLLVWVTLLFSSTLTVSEPCVTAAGVTRTSPPMTIVPVRAFTTTFADWRSGSISIFSSMEIKATF